MTTNKTSAAPLGSVNGAVRNKPLGDFTLNEVIAAANAAGETGQIGIWKRRVKEFAVAHNLHDREAIALIQLGPDIEKHFRCFYPPFDLTGGRNETV